MRQTFVLLISLLALPLAAQRKALTLETVYDPETRVSFSGKVQSGFQWIDDETIVWPARDEKNELLEWRLFDVRTGRTRPLFDRARLRHALEELGVTAEAAGAAAKSTELTFNEARDAFVFEAAGDLFLWSVPRGTLARLTSTAAKEEVPAFSPDGRRLAFVRENDLFVVDLESRRERRLTTTGSPDILNGRMDWVYEEEIFGRRNIRAHWWSPDSRRIVFLQLDERPVPRYTIVDHIPYRPEIEVYPYPKAGDPNPVARLLVAPAAGGELVPIDHGRYTADGFLIVNVGWTGDGRVTYQVQNRQQTWLDLNVADPAKGESRTLLRDGTPAWIDPIGNPVWLADGTFLWQSERTGWRHIAHHKSDGTLIRQVTSGEWEVRDFHGIDEKSGWIYFSGTERSVRDLDVYRVRLDGSGLQRLSSQAGTHAAKFNRSFGAFVDTWSDIRTPRQTRVHRADGSVAVVLEENRVPALAEYMLAQPEFLQVPTRDGFPMEALIIRPPDFDPARKYPVYQYLYGGPHAQQVVNRWRDELMLFHQLVAQEGIIVWMCDNRTASGKGAVSTWPLHKELGASELRDVEDGVAWLRQQPWVDGSRIMLSGWSYGGFMVAYALTHSRSFVAGISGAPVTDWRDYDTIYTERFLLTPQENPEGYRSSSPRFAAKDLHGSLLLIHGTIDDNVHLQNTLQFAYELQKGGKQFEMMLYPKTKHGIRDKALDFHRQRLTFGFILRNLKP